jgi:Zn-dependent protease
MAMEHNFDREEAGAVPRSRRWLNWLAQFLQAVFIGIGFVAMLGGSAALIAWLFEDSLPLAIAAATLSWFVVVATHEAGHFLGARLVGMTPFCVGGAGVMAWRSTNGWRLRKSGGWSGVAGYVMAHYSGEASLKRQGLVFILAGPFSNLLVGTALILIGQALPTAVFAFVAALGVFNVCVGLANLIPSRIKVLDNDGLSCLRLLRGEYDSGHQRALMLLNGMSCRGVQAQDLPGDLLQELDGVPQFGALLRAWFRLMALRNTGRWEEIADLSHYLDAVVSALPAAPSAAISAMIAQMRTEVAFARAMATGQDAAAAVEHVTDEVDWLFPALRPRCKALEAAQHGDAAGTRALLRESESKMRRAYDGSSIKSEQQLRTVIEAYCEQRRSGSDVVLAPGRARADCAD